MPNLPDDHPDQHLCNILIREAIPTGLCTPLDVCRTTLVPILQRWAGPYLVDITPSGSFAKGMANRSGTDIDIFVSLSPDTNETLKQIYNWPWQGRQDRRPDGLIRPLHHN